MQFVDFMISEDEHNWYCIQLHYHNETPGAKEQTKIALMQRDALKLFSARYMGRQLYFDSIEKREQFKTWAELKWT